MIRLCFFPVLSQKNVFKTCSSFWEKPVWNLTPLVGSEKFRKVKNVFLSSMTGGPSPHMPSIFLNFI